MGPATTAERGAVLHRSPVRGLYEQVIDRESAYEQLKARAAKGAEGAETAPQTKPEAKEKDDSGGWGLPEILTGTSRRQGILEAMAKSVARSIGSSIGRQIARGVLGSILRGK